MKEKSIYLKSGYKIIIQKINDNINHIIIYDNNIYPDEDSRSKEHWRLNSGLLIPINNNEDLKELNKLFEL